MAASSGSDSNKRWVTIDLEAITDDEIREWSMFMGYRVDPIDIALLKVQFKAMLEREAYDGRQETQRTCSNHSGEEEEAR